MRFIYVVTVDTDTIEHADKVMFERTGCDEEYGFDYTIEFEKERPEYNRCVLVTGNPIDGLQFNGPYATADDAIRTAELWESDDWWVGKLWDPPDEEDQ